MKAIVFRRSIPRFAALKLIAPTWRKLYDWPAAWPISLEDVPEPALPTPAWVRVAPRLSGVCGSDLSTIFAKGSPYLAPVTSMPFVLGHEVVGTVTEAGAEAEGVHVGDRVVLHPALGCVVRGIDPPCRACREGRDAQCVNVTRGVISRGIQTGYCRDTGGGWSGSLVAHASQLHRVPQGVSDRAAVLIEPFACAMHGALKARPGPDDVVLVIGAGSIGLLTIAALRATGCRAKVMAVARYEHQAALAIALGADRVLPARSGVAERYRQWAEALGAEVLRPELGKPTVLGGADVVYDCAATSESIDDAVRFTRGGGHVVLVGMPGIPRNVDWTPLWHKELTLSAAYAYGPEWVGPGDAENDGDAAAPLCREVATFEMAIERMAEWAPRLEGLVGEPFPLEQYPQALRCAMNTGRSRVIKTVFRID
ncbi:MAG: alcohol dehydrogenase [Phycisphaerales bacterium]|nr:MAG: alcohol dehydrogenase [Phycisphaerales bacterium]